MSGAYDPLDGARDSTDHAVRALGAVRPKLRHDVRISFQNRRGEPIYVLEDLVYRRYFQIGMPEYQFLLRLDGLRSAKQVLAEHVRQAGANALSENDAQTLLRWLIDHELLEAESAGQDDRRAGYARRKSDKKPKKGLAKVFFFKVPLGNPDAFLSGLRPWTSWFFSPAMLVVWCLLGIVALYTLAQSWSLFIGGAQSVVLPSNWITLLVTLGGLKIIHELAHGIAVKRYGAPVPEWGVQVLAFITPLTFVDASASWRFSQRWRRIVVAAAGMYIELFVASIAVLVWANTDGGMINTVAYNTIFAASTVTVLFNANPLMRFDGYYILTDLIALPNLAQRGQQFMAWASKKYLLGFKDLTMPPAVRERTKVIAAYGIGSMVWKVLIWIGIMTLVANLFQGAGIVLVAMSLLAAITTALTKFFKLLFGMDGGARPALFKTMGRVALIATALGALLYFIPVSPSPKVVAVVHYKDAAICRVETPGFVREVLVKNGEQVSEEQLLARLRNPAKEKQLRQVELALTSSELRARAYYEQGLLAAYQTEQETLKSLIEQQATLEELVEDLEIRAPVAGKVWGREITALTGRFVEAGEEIVSIVPKREPEILISAKQENSDDLFGRLDDKLEVRLKGRRTILPAKMERVETSATTALPHPALSSSAGGPLIVRASGAEQLNDRRRGLARNDRGEASYFAGLAPEQLRNANQELAEPRIPAVAKVSLDTTEESDLLEGEWGYAKLSNAREYRLGEWLYRKIDRFVRKKWEQARAAA